MCVDRILLVHSSIDGHLGHFHVLAVVDNTGNGKVGIQISLQVPASNSFGCISRSRIDGSCGNSVFPLFLKCFCSFLTNRNSIHCHSGPFLPFLEASHYIMLPPNSFSHPFFMHVDTQMCQGPALASHLHPWTVVLSSTQAALNSHTFIAFFLGTHAASPSSEPVE